MIKLKSSAAIIFLLAGLIVLTLFGLHEADLLQVLGLSALYLLVGVSVFLFVVRVIRVGRIFREIYFLVNMLLVLGFMYLLSGFLTLSISNSLVRFAQILSIVSLIYVFSYCAENFDKSVELYEYIFLISSIFVGGVSIVWATENSVVGFLNSNALGIWLAIAAIISVDVLCDVRFKILYLSFIFYAINITQSRTSLGALLVGLLIYFGWSTIVRRKIIYWGVLFVSLCLFAFVVWFFTNSSFDMDFFNEISQESSGKNLLSGRNVIWPILMDLIIQKPWFGWGGGVLIFDLIGVDLSAHNLFLQILIQVGFVGLLVFFVIVILVWKMMWSYREHRHAAGVCAAFFVVLMSQNFEVTMLQNNMALSFPMWAFVGIFIGSVRVQVNRFC